MMIDHVYERSEIFVVFDGPNGLGWHHPKDSLEGVEILAYLAEHPDALITEPLPPEPSPEELLRVEESQLLASLITTDWYATRFAETGKAIPDPIKLERDKARTRISEIRAKLAG